MTAEADQPKAPCCWIVAGETSGDAYGAALATALAAAQPGIRLAGMGAAKMRAAGVETYIDSEELKRKQEEAAAAEVERCYRKAKEILAANDGFFEMIASELAKKGLLTMKDIQEIKILILQPVMLIQCMLKCGCLLLMVEQCIT